MIKRGVTRANTSCLKQPLVLATISRRNTSNTMKEQALPQQPGVENLMHDTYSRDTYLKYSSRSTYADTLAPMEDAHALFPEVYTSVAFAKLEKEKVFKRAWTAIDHPSASLLDHGSVLSTTVGDIPVLIANHEGQLKGFYNVCRHRGSLLLKEGKYSKCNVIRCPYR